jgi:hypothetical protein
MTTTTDNIEPIQPQRNPQPSAELLEKISDCVTGFRKLEDAVKDTLAQAQREGFPLLLVGEMIRKALLAAGLHRSTIARYLPEGAKAKPRGRQVTPAQIANQFSSKMRQDDDNNNLLDKVEKVDKSVVLQLVPEDYKITLLEQYEKDYLIKIVKYLHNQIARLRTKLQEQESC